MSNRSRKPKEPSALSTVAMPRWPGGSYLELIQAFNDRYLECLARSAQWGDPRALPEILSIHRRLWMELEADARHRASQCPFVLADLQFGNGDWWKDARSGQRSDRGARGGAIFPWIISMEMARGVLTVAWYTAREDICLAVLLIGMSAEVAGIIANFSLHELWQFADRHHECVRPRHENQYAFWGRLLGAATHGDRASLNDLHRHAFLLSDAKCGQRAPIQGRTPEPRN